jgi:hypothetical protein
MKFKELAYCLLLTVGHFFYTLSFPSLLNGDRFIWSGKTLLEPSYIHSFFISRIKFGEFARRPITTWLIQSLEAIGLPLEYAFIAVLYTGLFLALVALFKLSTEITKNNDSAYLSVLIFTSSFWVLNGFFTEIYSYDEPIQYALVFVALIYAYRNEWFKFSIPFFLALTVRESTVLLLPGLFFFFMIKQPLFSKKNILNTLKVAWTVPAYGFFLWLVIWGKNLEEKSSSYMEDVRFKHLFYSFETLDQGIVTLTSFMMAFLVPVAIIFIYRSKFGFGDSKKWIWATIINVSLNSVITFTLTMGRETRIFAQPVLMLSPFLGYFLIRWIKSLSDQHPMRIPSFDSWVKTISILLGFGTLCFAFSLFAYEIYWPTDTKFFNGFQHAVYLSLSFGLGLFALQILKQTLNIKITSIAILLSMISLSFTLNQHGYRAFDTYKPLVSSVEQISISEKRPLYLLIGTQTPNIAENYLSTKEIDALAGDFNLQFPIKQFFYRMADYERKSLLYVEEFAATNFPFRYMLSQFGATEQIEVNGSPALLIRTNETPEIEPHTWQMVKKETGFQNKDEQKDGAAFNCDEEYSPAFKARLGDLSLPELHSIAAKVDFKTEMNSEAAIVVNINSKDTTVWEHEFLSVFLIDTEGWNTAYKAFSLNGITDPDAEISFYVWNKNQDQTTIKNLEIVLNSKFLPASEKK